MKGSFYVLSAPSGSGKSTLIKAVMSRSPELVYSVSYATRAPRPGEVDGRDYNFVSQAEFARMIEGDEFLEWAEVFGNFYGTGRAWVEERLQGSHSVIADVDVVGAASIRKKLPGAVLIFIAPPSRAELEKRLRGRHSEKEEQIQRRLADSAKEIAARGLYDYLVVNDNFEAAVAELLAITQGRPGRPMRGSENFWANWARA